KSKNIPLTVEKIKEQLDRLGNTRFYLNDIKIDLDDHLFMTHKDLNRLRRVALAKLEDEISNFNNRMKLENQDFNRHKGKMLRTNSFQRDKDLKLSIKVESMDQLRKLNLNKVDRMYLPINSQLSSMVNELKGYDLERYLWTDKIL